METAILLLQDHLIDLKAEMDKPWPIGKNSKQVALLEKAKENQAEAISEVEQAISLLKSENPQDVSGSCDTSGDLHASYQMEGEADSDTDANEAVAKLLPKRIEDGNSSPFECNFVLDVCKTCGISGESHDIIGCGLE